MGPTIDDSHVLHDPAARFDVWWKHALALDVAEPAAATLSTTAEDGFPEARIILVRDVNAEGFVFYTNRQSDKGAQLAADNRACLSFWWEPLWRQVRVVGHVSPISDAESDAYFAARARGSQLGAWASHQSRPVDSRETLMARVDAFSQQFEGQDVKRPPHWGGYRLVPTRYEFWQAGAFRLHDRWRYTRSTDAWTHDRLYP